jgi:hypothetical protein
VRWRSGVVNAGAMKTFNRLRKHRTPAARRTKLLAAFERSGLSAAAFARQHGLSYTTFCGWRHRQARTHSPAFVQVELPPPPAPVDLTLELPGNVRLHLISTRQIELAARLIQALHTPKPC